MRITEREVTATRLMATEGTGQDAKVTLFGSRTRNDLRGGDIDLLIELYAPTRDTPSMSLHAGLRLQRLPGERKIDVLVTDPDTDETPFTVDLALATQAG
jgi:predicted nucleotidyltransferase